MIKIAIFMPRIGNGIRKIEDLKEGQYAWTSIDKKNYYQKVIQKIIAEEEILNTFYEINIEKPLISLLYSSNDIIFLIKI